MKKFVVTWKTVPFYVFAVDSHILDLFYQVLEESEEGCLSACQSQLPSLLEKQLL